MKKPIDEYRKLAAEVARIEYEERNVPELDRTRAKAYLIQQGYTEQGAGIALFKMRKNEAYLEAFIQCRNAEAKKLKTERAPENKKDGYEWKAVRWTIEAIGQYGTWKYDGSHVSWRQSHKQTISFTAEEAKTFLKEMTAAMERFGIK